MSNDFQKRYIEVSGNFRKSNASAESLAQLYDLLYELEKAESNKTNLSILYNTYSLLGFHQSAYEVFKQIADTSNRKDQIKLHTLADKAASHKNTFIIKDIRKFREKFEAIQLKIEHFTLSDENDKQLLLNFSPIVIFNKKVESKRIKIHAPDQNIEQYIQSLKEHFNFLSDCKNELIQFYNNDFEKYNDAKADDDWFDLLEIYGLRIDINTDNNISSWISAGDSIEIDHILDIEIYNNFIEMMNYDG